MIAKVLFFPCFDIPLDGWMERSRKQHTGFSRGVNGSVVHIQSAASQQSTQMICACTFESVIRLLYSLTRPLLSFSGVLICARATAYPSGSRAPVHDCALVLSCPRFVALPGVDSDPPSCCARPVSFPCARLYRSRCAWNGLCDPDWLTLAIWARFVSDDMMRHEKAFSPCHDCVSSHVNHQLRQSRLSPHRQNPHRRPCRRRH